MSTYIGCKGYTIYKECLSPSELNEVRKELLVRPYIPKAPVQPDRFPVFRESATKIYLPRFFGINTYGEPDEYNIPKGASINVSFHGELREIQHKVINAYMNTVNEEHGGGGLIELRPGQGKTIMALNIISRIKRKTLVIVHKSFLLNQWIERIEQFLPSARVGKIQGQIVDIEDKDIVIGMLQSLSMKEYPSNTFNSFGLTIVDEAHHIGSEVFSRSLSRIVTPYMLGLSATMQRKDGLTKVFKMFLGEIVYKDKRNTDDPVLVKAIRYQTDDVKFNETAYDYRGNPSYSTMITKLCEFNHRSEAILRAIQTELNEQPNQQIMVLAHNKNLLVYLYKAIEHRNIAPVGYYLGGMKEADLKASESKQIIIATYAMAAEGLDIKTLTTLVLATPKTDVTQSVGRILRAKHSRPLVIDFIDPHQVFKNQWEKRRKYYQKNKYTIQTTTMQNYTQGIWDTNHGETKPNKCLIELNSMSTH